MHLFQKTSALIEFELLYKGGFMVQGIFGSFGKYVVVINVVKPDVCEIIKPFLNST